jgi:hypothetical protein
MRARVAQSTAHIRSSHGILHGRGVFEPWGVGRPTKSRSSDVHKNPLPSLLHANTLVSTKMAYPQDNDNVFPTKHAAGNFSVHPDLISATGAANSYPTNYAAGNFNVHLDSGLMSAAGVANFYQTLYNWEQPDPMVDPPARILTPDGHGKYLDHHLNDWYLTRDFQTRWLRPPCH